MQGMDSHTGKLINSEAHLVQSIKRRIETPLGSKWIRREYGSRLHLLQDQPITPELVSDAVAYSAEALEPLDDRFDLKHVKPTYLDALGKTAFLISGLSLETGDFIELETTP